MSGSVDAQIKSRREGSVLMVTIGGLLTAPVLKNLIVLLVAEDRRKVRPSAAVVDLRKAVICVGPEDWAASATSNRAQGVQFPMAALVSPANLDAAHQHCFRMAQRGLARFAFTEPSKAKEWAISRGEWYREPDLSRY